MKQMTYMYDDGIFYYVFSSADVVFVHTGKGSDLIIGRGKTIEEAMIEVKNIINKQNAPLF